MQVRPALAMAERLAQHFRAEARSAHAEQNDIGGAGFFGASGKALQLRDILQLAIDDICPSEPLVLIRSSPRGIVLGPKTAGVAAGIACCNFLLDVFGSLAEALVDGRQLGAQERNALLRQRFVELVGSFRELRYPVDDELIGDLVE